jgi:hypothetical protein
VTWLRRALILTHRWLGIAFGLLFVTWFASGIVMIYARMPALTADDRLAHLMPLDLTAARVPLAAAARIAGDAPQRVRIAMWGDRPVYRFAAGGRWATVFADSGDPLAAATRQHAIDEARRFAPGHGGALAYQGRIHVPDQWTFDQRAAMPLHVLRLGDPQDTVVYISAQTGEPVQRTTRSSRRWGYLGAVIHWIYFTPLRSNGPLWTQLIIWTSIAGVVMCLTGIVWGLWQFLPRRGVPYTGWMRWHHIAGLAFGAATLGFVFSGLLSVEPWSWHPGTAPSRQQREAATGGPLALEGITPDHLRAALAPLGPVKEIEIVMFRGEPFVHGGNRLVAARHPERGAFAAFDQRTMEMVAIAAMPGAAVRDMIWLTRHDAYYYSRSGELPLPVLRVRYRDPPRTWLYLDPSRGAVVRKEERLTRVNRWLYHGLHSWDFPWLYDRRPLWDIVVVALNLGGLASAVTAAVPAWRRLKRQGRVGPRR